MAETLLTVVNRVLKEVKVVKGEDGELASLTESARQVFIDAAVSKINQFIYELSLLDDEPMQGETASSTITLLASTREYSLPTDLVQIRFPLIDQTDGHSIEEYPGGYEKMRLDQTIPSQHEGRPNYAVINPTTGDLRMDKSPTSAEAGAAYDLLYDKSLTLSLAADTFPFHDDVIIAGVPAIAQLWKQTQRKDSDPVAYKISFGQAAAFLSQKPHRSSY